MEQESAPTTTVETEAEEIPEQQGFISKYTAKIEKKENEEN
mgnify:CR=1 FL=1|jgi:hypothetical protein